MSREVDTLPALLAAPAPVFADAVEEVAEEVVEAVPEDEGRVVTVVESVEGADGGETVEDGGGGMAVEEPRAGARLGPRRMVDKATGGEAVVDGFGGAATGRPGRGAGTGVTRMLVEPGGEGGDEDEPGSADEDSAEVDVLDGLLVKSMVATPKPMI